MIPQISQINVCLDAVRTRRYFSLTGEFTLLIDGGVYINASQMMIKPKMSNLDLPRALGLKHEFVSCTVITTRLATHSHRPKRPIYLRKINITSTKHNKITLLCRAFFVIEILGKTHKVITITIVFYVICFF